MVLVPELVQSPAPVARPPAKVVMLPCVSTLRTGPLESVKYTLPRLSTAMCVGPLSCTPVAVAEPPSPGDCHHPDGLQRHRAGHHSHCDESAKIRASKKASTGASADDSKAKSKVIREDANKQIRALLTPDQQKIFDASSKKEGGKKSAPATASEHSRSEERRVGKECRSRWS